MAMNHKGAYLILIARLVVAAAFILAALPKIQDPVAFAASVDGFRVVSGELTLWVAVFLPWLELVIGFGLLIPQIRLGSGVLISSLLLVFMGLHISAWMRGLDINCGCFTTEASTEPPNYIWLLVRNSGLLLATISVLYRDIRNLSAASGTIPIDESP
ncbi:MAG: hypothetical protein EA353_06670 [Puniceicoccaceae bacterium]|nr:MAG: hypothetical protein EA353_06670 [Puniceicoccaceae bacterium]